MSGTASQSIATSYCTALSAVRTQLSLHVPLQKEMVFQPERPRHANRIKFVDLVMCVICVGRQLPGAEGHFG